MLSPVSIAEPPQQCGFVADTADLPEELGAIKHLDSSLAASEIQHRTLSTPLTLDSDKDLQASLSPEGGPALMEKIRHLTSKDKNLQLLIRFVQSAFRKRKQDLPSDLQ